MAVQTEMYSPVGANVVVQQPVRQSSGRTTWWDRFMNAVRIKFGPDIEVQNTKAVKNKLACFVNDLLFTVVHSSPEPSVTRPTIIDVTFKEFVNLGEKEKDETTIQVGKNCPITVGSKYQFSMTEGVKFDRKYNFGAQIVSLCMVGGYMSVGTNYTIKELAYNKYLQFRYHQKEKLIIPPKTKITAKITTSTRKYSQDYTLEFSTPRSRRIRVSYLTRTQQQFNLGCGQCCQPSEGYIYAADIMRTLPNFKDADGFCSFTQVGTLTWIGEGCTVEKSEQPLGDLLL